MFISASKKKYKQRFYYPTPQVHKVSIRNLLNLLKPLVTSHIFPVMCCVCIDVYYFDVFASLQIKGYPFGNIFSVSDGPFENSTGVIYFYVTAMDNSVADLRSNPNASFTISESEGEYCRFVMIQLLMYLTETLQYRVIRHTALLMRFDTNLIFFLGK